MKLTILLDESQNITACNDGYIAVLMINEWWLFYKKHGIEQLGIFERLENTIEFINEKII